VLLRNVKYLLRKCEMAAPRYIGFANVKCASHIAGRRLRRCVKVLRQGDPFAVRDCKSVRWRVTGFGIGNLQRIQSTRFRLRIVRAAAQNVGLLCGKPRPQFRIPNSEFRIHFGFGSFAPRQRVSDCCVTDPRPQFRIPNSEFRIARSAPRFPHTLNSALMSESG